jgi:hypothetical protein
MYLFDTEHFGAIPLPARSETFKIALDFTLVLPGIYCEDKGQV